LRSVRAYWPTVHKKGYELGYVEDMKWDYGAIYEIIRRMWGLVGPPRLRRRTTSSRDPAKFGH
jgi:hypothetical protein